MNERTWSLLGRLLSDLLIAFAFAGQLICPIARGNEQILKSFGSADKAGWPMGGLIEGVDGVLYGTTLNGDTVFAINPDGSGFKVLHNFGSSINDATNPVGPLVLGLDGALYGISGGGAKGVGAIFTLRPDGTGYKVLHRFGSVAQDGTSPQAPLVQALDSTLCGATYSGGASNVGTVFSVKPDGTGYRLLHSFEGSPNDGANPQAGLMLGKDGALYGTTWSGGTNTIAVGTVFKLNADGSGFMLLHSFGGADGTNPSGALFQGTDGALYGTTLGPLNSYYGNVFRVNPNGSGYLVLCTLHNPPPVAVPKGGLVQGTDGSLYGVTSGTQAKGNVFKVNPDGTGYAVVHVFGSLVGDGWSPNGPLLLGKDGALYGTTYYGGALQLGTVFRLTTLLPASPFIISIVPLAGGSFHVEFEGIVGLNYRLDASTNLSDWTTQGTVSNETGLVQFLDWNETKSPQRFYRAVSMP